MKNLKIFCLLIPVILFYSCSGSNNASSISISYDSFPRMIDFPAPDPASIEEFNRNIPGIEKMVTKENGKTYGGFVTTNREFYDKKMKPLLLQNIDKLKNMKKTELINTLALFGHEIFRTYFGKDFYRWAGDINDLDDPQSRLPRFSFRYGLDCSGFSCMPYEIAVDLSLMDAKDEGALFCSKGFENYCKQNSFTDIGGQDNLSNKFRLDTKDLNRIGRIIFSLEKNGEPTAEQLSMLQPGDLVLKSGHVGIIVMIENKMCFLESGGVVVPKNGGFPCIASEALKLFAKGGPMTIRRALPDMSK